MGQYFNMATSTTFVPHIPAMTTVPISFRLREHHCINPETPTAPGGSSLDVLDDGITSAWFPTDFQIRETSEGVRVDDPRYGGSSSWYERYREGKGNSHNEETCTQCRFKREQEEAELHERVRAHKRASEERDDEDDSDEDEHDHGEDGDADDSHAGPAHLRVQRQRLPSPSLRHHPHDHDHDIHEPQPGVTRPDGPGSGVDPGAEMRIQFTQALGQDVDEFLDAEMESADEEDEEEEGDWEEYVENTCNGIQDIIITGEVSDVLLSVGIRKLTLR